MPIFADGVIRQVRRGVEVIAIAIICGNCLNTEMQRVSASQHRHRDGLRRVMQIHCREEIGHRNDWCTVNLRYDIPRPQSCEGGGRAGQNIRDDDSMRLAQVQALRERRRDGLQIHANHTASHGTVASQLFINISHDGSRDRETQTLAASGLTENQSIDP
jgi:hypothetical protein